MTAQMTDGDRTRVAPPQPIVVGMRIPRHLKVWGALALVFLAATTASTIWLVVMAANLNGVVDFLKAAIAAAGL